MDLCLANVPNHYRPAPFWSWNEKLDPQELRRQIREMHKAGIGGFFMHARGGLQTGYLSPEWMACVEACLDEAAKFGMEGWLYDENGWPSGFGGGLVNGLGLKYQQKYLRHEVIDAAQAAEREHSIAFYSADGRELLGKTLPAGTQGNVLRCFFEVNPYYVDNMDASVVAEFLRVTHQHYYETLPPELMKHLRGIFTDEPQLSRQGILWSGILEEEYRKEYGIDLLKELPELFLDSAAAPAVRIRYWRLCTRLFSQNFLRQIRDWCDAHNWELTGHQLLEETCVWQLSSNGAVMPHYRYYHVPGVDHLGRSQASPVAAVQLASVAAQYGQKQLLTESFAMTGWACNFTGMRWIYQQQMAHGINYLCVHLQGYSLRGLRKRDYPASAFYHQPWWEDYRTFNDAVSRVGMLLAEGEQDVRVLVIHPQSSAWKLYVGIDRDCPGERYSESLERLTRELDALLIGHHYADETIVDECGSVAEGRFRIGKVAYDCVIVPQLSNFSGKIAKLLKAFHADGGTVFVVRDQQEDGVLTIDGIPADSRFRHWFEGLPSFGSEAAAARAAAELQPDRVRITENGVPASGVVGTRRKVTLDGRSGWFCYFAATSYRKNARLHFALPCTGPQVELLDQETGALAVLDGVTAGADALEFDGLLPGAGSLTFFVADSAPGAEAHHCELVDPTLPPAAVRLRDGFLLKKSSGNLLTLDRCRYCVDGGEWNECFIIDLQTRLLALGRDCDLEMEVEFFCDEDFDCTAPLKLAAETPERFRFTLNGVPFAPQDEGYLFDKAFRLCTLPLGVKPGRNVIGLAARFTQPPELYRQIEDAKKFEGERNKLSYDFEVESLYLCGDFSVRHNGRVETLLRDAVRCDGNFTLGAPLTFTTVKASDLLASGMPFFAGKLVLEQSFELTAEELASARWLRLDLRGANSCRVRINGEDLGARFGLPFAWEAGAFLREGANHIELELTTSLRNMLGPHHLAVGESYAVSPGSFWLEENIFGDPPPPNVPGYSFVNFGIVSPEFAGKRKPGSER